MSEVLALLQPVRQADLLRAAAGSDGGRDRCSNQSITATYTCLGDTCAAQHRTHRVFPCSRPPPLHGDQTPFRVSNSLLPPSRAGWEVFCKASSRPPDSFPKPRPPAATSPALHRCQSQGSQAPPLLPAQWQSWAAAGDASPADAVARPGHWSRLAATAGRHCGTSTAPSAAGLC